eukprot:6465443-Prorocentrum_lima.AAC.1
MPSEALALMMLLKRGPLDMFKQDVALCKLTVQSNMNTQNTYLQESIHQAKWNHTIHNIQ